MIRYIFDVSPVICGDKICMADDWQREDKYMKDVMRKQSLRTVFCLLLVITMVVTILLESVQAAGTTSGFTTEGK